MKRIWLVFSQAVTVVLATYFVLLTLKPSWLGRPASPITVMEAKLSTSAAAAAPGSFRQAAQLASAAVVSINTSKAARRHPNSDDPWFRFFFGDGNDEPQVGLGSGVIVSPDGYILTNNHVIEGADEIEVVLNDNRRARAKLIGNDPDTDLAVLQIKVDKLPVIILGSPDNLQIGDPVLAIGNPFGVGQTVTSGIVSALGRSHLGINTFENFIQTDAAINPGNSGGALVDTQGHLQGINTAIYSRSGGNMGIGFAIPISTARQVLESLVRDGRVTRGWIGVEPNDLTPELIQTFGIRTEQGVLITGVLSNGPAALAGIRPGDVISSVEGKGVSNVAELLGQVASLQPGKSARFDVQRQSQKMSLEIVPGVRPKPRRPTQAQ
ncbi:MAG: S1C family serine protease [Hylemonella sp.]